MRVCSGREFLRQSQPSKSQCWSQSYDKSKLQLDEESYRYQACGKKTGHQINVRTFIGLIFTHDNNNNNNTDGWKQP